MNCREIRAQLEELFAAGPAGQAGTTGREEVDRHLASCANCREAARILRQTSAWLRLTRDDPPTPSPAFWARLETALAERQAASQWLWWPLEFYARPLAYVLAGIVLALGLSLAVIETPARSEPTALAEFDAPQPAAMPLMPAATNGHLDRDQVMLTLVSEPERKP